MLDFVKRQENIGKGCRILQTSAVNFTNGERKGNPGFFSGVCDGVTLLNETDFMPEKPQFHTVCPECGARVEPGMDFCELCGTPLSEEVELSFEEEEALLVEAAEAGSQQVRLPVCPTCGWENPADARFCNQCGTRLSRRSSRASMPAVEAPPAGDASASTPGTLLSSPLVWVAAVAVLALVFFGLSRMSEKQADPTTVVETSTGTLEMEPIPPAIKTRAQQLEQAMEQASSEQERLEQMRELVLLYGQSGLYVRAAALQKQIAEELDTPEAWAMVGHLYYDGMLQSQGEKRVAMARNAVEAYQRSLELNPDNLDVRTDMAVAYLNIPDEPMEAIRQINIVLERNPDHLQANFNKGIMLAQIGRVEQAIAHFEKVKELSEPGSEPYERAQQMIEALQQAKQ